MPQLLSMTPNQGESDDDFAARVSAEVDKFFTGAAGEAGPQSTEAAPESTKPAAESTGETSTESTAPSDVPPKEGDTTAAAVELEFDADMNAAFQLLMAEFGRGPGWVTNPKGTERLHEYWIHGKGAAKIKWGVPGDFKRCVKEVGAEIGEHDPGKLRFINAICAQWHKDATGGSPGHAPTEGG